MYHFAPLKGQAKIYRGNRGKTGKMAQTKRRTTTKRKAAPRKRKPQPKADMSASWSILLFGLAILVAAMTYVPGASAWAWLRMNVLFGVFGVSTYLLAPALVYLEMCIRDRCNWEGIKIIEAEVCPDHIHMLIEIPPKIAVASFMGYLKGKSSLMLYEDVYKRQLQDTRPAAFPRTLRGPFARPALRPAFTLPGSLCAR